MSQSYQPISFFFLSQETKIFHLGETEFFSFASKAFLMNTKANRNPCNFLRQEIENFHHREFSITHRASRLEKAPFNLEQKLIIVVFVVGIIDFNFDRHFMISIFSANICVWTWYVYFEINLLTSRFAAAENFIKRFTFIMQPRALFTCN